MPFVLPFTKALHSNMATVSLQIGWSYYGDFYSSRCVGTVEPLALVSQDRFHCYCVMLWWKYSVRFLWAKMKPWISVSQKINSYHGYMYMDMMENEPKCGTQFSKSVMKKVL